MRLCRSRLKTIVVLIGAIANCGIRVNVDFRFTNPECTRSWAGELRESHSALHLFTRELFKNTDAENSDRNSQPCSVSRKCLLSKALDTPRHLQPRSVSAAVDVLSRPLRVTSALRLSTANYSSLSRLVAIVEKKPFVFASPLTVSQEMMMNLFGCISPLQNQSSAVEQFAL